jgi:hypothetical protein
MIASVFQEGGIRISNLNSNGIMRTCAVVNFSLPIPEWLKNTHDEIYAGSSIGQTIKDNGFDLKKEDDYFGITKLPKVLQDKMETDEDLAAVHIYHLLIKDPQTAQFIAYCTISEIHSPLYLTLKDLNRLNHGSLKHNGLTESVQTCLGKLSVLDQLFIHSNNNKP